MPEHPTLIRGKDNGDVASRVVVVPMVLRYKQKSGRGQHGIYGHLVGTHRDATPLLEPVEPAFKPILQTNPLHRPCADGSRAAMGVLVVVCEQMTCERTRTINALTALVRIAESGFVERKSLTCSKFTAIAKLIELGMRVIPLRRADWTPCGWPR